MRINRDILLKIAEETVSKVVRRDHSVLAAYLCGALLEEDFLLGGTADIDLAFIHIDTPPVEREVQRLTDEIHLDIAHYDQGDFQQARNLRMHPWLGPTIYACKVMYDPQHFMDFTQASVRGQFYRSDYILGRATQQVEHARQIWLGFASQVKNKPGPRDLITYLRAIEHAANAVASLDGPPLPERRLLIGFPARAEATGRPGLYPALLGMLGAPQVDGDELKSWLPSWQGALESLPKGAIPARLNPCRHVYYRRSFEEILDGERPADMLWPLLRTWTIAAASLSDQEEGYTAWRRACQRLGLLGEGFSERVMALDAFLDLVEETIEDRSRQYGE